MNRTITFITLIASALALGAAQAAPQIAAQLQPDQIALGEASRLIVTLSGTGSKGVPSLPEVDGLRFQPTGQSSQIRIVNGQTSSSTGFTYRVTAERPGEYEIPPIAFQGVQTEPLKLRVAKAMSQPQQPLSPPGTAPAGKATVGSEGLAFLRIERADNGERSHLYVGELTPIAIRVFVREGVQIRGLSKPTLDGGAFTLHQLSEEPQQQSATIDGKRYRVLSWFAGLSGVKAGDENLVGKLDATLGLPQKSQPRARQRQSPFGGLGGSLFDDPFFDSVFDDFFQRVEPREVSLVSDAAALEIRALPDDGRPESFTGAVGQFKLGHFSIPAELTTGEPSELQINVTGEGNFDRVEAPRLSPAGRWKTYAAKDSTDPGDSIGFKASKTFTLPAIALEPGEFEAGFSFDFFDPESGEYRTVQTDPMPIVVTGNPVASAGPTEPDTGSEAASASDSLAPPRSAAGRAASPPGTLHDQVWFIALQAVPASALIAAAAIALIRLRRDDPAAVRSRAIQKVIDQELAELTSARQAQDGAKFFSCARRALQYKLAERWDCNPVAITSEDVSRRLPAAAEVTRVFTMADAVEFSGMPTHPDSFGEWQDRVSAALREIDSPEAGSPPPPKRSWGETPQTA